MTLVELLISMTVMSVVLAATLTVVEFVQRQNAEAIVRVDSRDRARTVMDRMIKRLRSPVELPGGMVERADPFESSTRPSARPRPRAGQTNATGLQRVRVCLDPATGRIYRQRKAFTALPAPVLAGRPSARSPRATTQTRSSAPTSPTGRPAAVQATSTARARPRWPTSPGSP